MDTFDPAAYGPAFAPLLAGDRLRPLGGGRGDATARRTLQGVTLATAFRDAHLVDLDMARCCLAGLWLLHDFLDESHSISQQIETPSGSFWHGVMHRREGDFSNAKYWFRHVGQHEVFGELGPAIAQLGLGDGKAVQRVTSSGAFDPYAFVDACEAAVRSGDDLACREIQRLEWEHLFDHCYRTATGA